MRVAIVVLLAVLVILLGAQCNAKKEKRWFFGKINPFISPACKTCKKLNTTNGWCCNQTGRTLCCGGATTTTTTATTAAGDTTTAAPTS